MHSKHLLLALPLTAQALDLRLITFNIRYDNTDISPGTGEAHWLSLACSSDPTQCRASGVITTLYKADSDATTAGASTIIGLQEVLDNQLTDIVNGLGSSKWDHVGVARDDGKKDGEYVPILYRTDVWTLVEGKTRWLSETPDVAGSISWGSGSKRVVVAAVLEHKATGTRVLHANTHLDNASSEAREKGVAVVLDTIKAMQATYGNNLPVSLTGDFNSDPSDGAYKTLAAAGYVKEMYDMATTAQRSGPNATYTGFLNEASSRIDFIWLGPETNSSWAVDKYTVMENLVNGTMMSDHRPVVGDVTLG